MLETAEHCFLVSSVVVGLLCRKVSNSPAALGIVERLHWDSGECWLSPGNAALLGRDVANPPMAALE